MTAITYRNNNTVPLNFEEVDNNFEVITQKISATRLKTVNMLTLALSYTDTPDFPMPTPGTTNIRLGQGQTGSTEIAAALIWNTVLSDEDMDLAYDQVKAFFLSKSIII